MKKKAQPWFSGQISQLLLQFIMGLAEKLLHFYKSSSFSQECYFNNIQILIRLCLKTKRCEKTVPFPATYFHPASMKTPLGFLWKERCPFQHQFCYSEIGVSAFEKINNRLRWKASKMLVISQAVRTRRALNLHKLQRFRIQYIDEQSMPVPNWQYHSKSRNTQKSGLDGEISLYFLYFISDAQHWILDIFRPSCRCSISKDSLANGLLLINSSIAGILYPKGCKQKSDNIFTIYAQLFKHLYNFCVQIPTLQIPVRVVFPLTWAHSPQH